MWLIARGQSGGRPARYACWPRRWFYSTTESLLAVATLAMVRGEVRARGVVPPEVAFEPSDALFATLAGFAGTDASQEPLFDESIVYEDSVSG